MKYAVEKIENNIVVLESLDNNMKKEVLLSKLPKGTKEGTILTYENEVYKKENGEWKEYDYSITENENADEAEKFVIENSDSEMSFPEEFSEDSAQIEVSAREYDIKFSPVVEKKLFNKNSKGKVKDHKKLKSNEIISFNTPFHAPSIVLAC